MNKIGIYKIISPTGKIYIGQSINIEKRWEGHKIHNGIGPQLKNSYIKYGFESHEKEIIEECSLEQLNGREIYWKKYFTIIKKFQYKWVPTSNDPKSKKNKISHMEYHKDQLLDTIGIPF